MQALKALVIVMGVLIVAGTTVVVVTIYNRMQKLGEAAPEPAATAATIGPTASMPASTVPLPVFGEVPVALPDGCRVVEMVPAGERLMLRLGSVARCNRILVLDLGSGAVLGSFDLAPQD